MSDLRKPHVCTDDECIYLGKPSADSCRCHLTATENEIASLRAQLASTSRELADAKSNATYLSNAAETAFRDRDYYSVRLASARKALEEIYIKDTRVTDGGKCHDLGPCAEIATAALFSLSDEKGTS